MRQKETLDLIVTKNLDDSEGKGDISNAKLNDWLMQQLSALLRNNLDSLVSIQDKIKYLNEITNSAFALEGKHVKINDFDLSDNLFDNLTLPETFNKGLFKRIREELRSCEEAIFISPFISKTLQELLRFPEDLEDLKKLAIYTTTFDHRHINLNLTVLEAIKKEFSNKVDIKIENVVNNDDRLHAKIYYFKRKNNMSSLYVGSSNLSNAGLKTGNEFTIKISEFNNSTVFNKFDQFVKALSNQENMIDILDNEAIAYLKLRIMAQKDNEFQIQRIVSEHDEKVNEEDKTSNSLKKINELLKKREEDEEDNYKLFDYQINAIDSLNNRYINGQRKHLIVMATGTGKTIVALKYVNEIAKRLEWEKPRVLFLAHRTEILEQTKIKFREICGYSENDIMDFYSSKNDLENFNKKHLIIASVQTLRNHKELLESSRFDLTIVDEVHHVDNAAKTFKNLFEIASTRSNEVLGLTATPIRTNGNDVSDYFDGIERAVDLPLFKSLERNYLAPFDYFMLFSDQMIDFSIEDSPTQLTKFLNEQSKIDLIKKIISTNIEPLKEEVSCLIFCSSIENANYVKNNLKKLDFNIEALTSELTIDSRKRIVNSFKDGTINYLCVVDIFNEGVDIPKINNVIFLRPTTSPLIFTQQLGRGLRKLEGKRLNVFDIVNNVNVNKNKNLNPLNYLMEIANVQGVDDVISNPKILDAYLPESCNLWISRIDEQKISKLLRDFKNANVNNINKQKILLLQKIKDRSSYDEYFKYITKNYYDPAEFYNGEITFTKNEDKTFSRILYLISLINKQQILAKMLQLVANRKKTEIDLVNNLFLKSYFNAANKPQNIGLKNIEESWKHILNDENNYLREIEFLLKFKVGNNLSIKSNERFDIESLIGITLMKQQIGVLAPIDIYRSLRGNAELTGIIERDGIAIITTSEENNFNYENKINMEEKTIRWSAPNEWKINDSKKQRNVIEAGEAKIFIFVKLGDADKKYKKDVYTLIGKVISLKGPFENSNKTLYYDLKFVN